MTINVFENFDRKRKFEAVFKRGLVVATREDCFSVFILYKLKSFYIELSFPIKGDEQVDLRAFSYEQLPLTFLEYDAVP